MKSLKFTILDGSFTIHRLKPGTSLPKGLTASPFYSISGSEDELSVVAPDAVWMESEKAEPGWACLKINGPLDFAETGILAGVTASLAKADVSIFAVSTFDTDYILVKHDQLKTAKDALSAEGHKFTRPQRSALADVRTTPTMNAYAALLERQFPLIKNLLLEKVGAPALAAMRSEPVLLAAIGGLYEFMPTPVRLMVNRELFVNYCFKNLDRILPEVNIPAKKKPATPKTK